MNRAIGIAVASLLSTAIPPAALAFAADDRFTLMGDLPGSWEASFGQAISADGQTVVGGSWAEAGHEAFKWTQAGGMIGLGEIPGGLYYSVATAVSADGSVIVGESDIGNQRSRAFRWTEADGLVELPLCSNCPDQACSTTAYDVSGDGFTAVGLCGFIPTGDFQAVRWDGDLVTELGQLTAYVITSDGSVIAGTTPDRTAWVWRADEKDPTFLGELAPDGHSEPWAVSDDGNTACGHAGIFIDGVFTDVPFLWTRDGGMRQIEVPGGIPWGNAWGMTADGSVIVGSSPCPECPGAFSAWLWTAEEGARLLDEIAAADYGINLGNMHLAQAFGISPDGQWIAGDAHADTPGTFDLAMRLHLVEACSADLDHNGALDLFDFLAFVNLFNAGDPKADCDHNGARDLFDFLCFVNAFNEGC